MEKLFRICNVLLAPKDFTVLKTIQQNVKNALRMVNASVKILQKSYQVIGERPKIVIKYFLALDMSHVCKSYFFYFFK